MAERLLIGNSHNCEIGRITGLEVFFVSSREHFLLPNFEEAPSEPLAMTFHFLGERLALKGPREGVPTFPWMSTTHQPVFLRVPSASY